MLGYIFKGIRTNIPYSKLRNGSQSHFAMSEYPNRGLISIPVSFDPFINGNHSLFNRLDSTRMLQVKDPATRCHLVQARALSNSWSRPGRIIGKVEANMSSFITLSAFLYRKVLMRWIQRHCDRNTSIRHHQYQQRSVFAAGASAFV